MRILIIDPGATTTKIGIYQDIDPEVKRTISHDRETIDSYAAIADQEEMRYGAIRELLQEEEYLEKRFDAVVGRGGLVKPLEGGTYEVNDVMLEDLRKGVNGEHASNLGGILAARFASHFGVRAFIVDPVVVDELEPEARLSGLAGVQRSSIFHALNQKAVARKIARKLGRKYTDVNLIVAHLGSGVSVGAHRRGRVIDVNNALDGDGPYSQERTGSLPVRSVITLIEEGVYSPGELLGIARREGGIYSYLGEANLQEVERRIEAGDEKARLVFQGMAYQTAKEIGALAAVLKGEVDGVVLTGGGARSDRLVSLIRERVYFVAPLFILPGELELEALAEGVMRVLGGEEKAKIYG
jgi:butyrate kinase